MSESQPRNPFESPSESGDMTVQPKRPPTPWLVWIGSCVLLLALIFVLLAPFQRGGAREAVRRTQCISNLKQIVLAMHNYHAVHGRFPPAYTVDEQGNRLHSWRTLILPFMDAGNVFERLDLEKPWDDPVNRECWSLMPGYYHCPSRSGKDGQQGPTTTYLAIVSDNSCLRGEKSISMNEIMDGPELTILVLEVPDDQAVPWMSPFDLAPDQLPMPATHAEFGHQGGLNTAMADGSVHFFSQNRTHQFFRALSTVDGGEAIDEF